jgi:hypothetical protein
VATTDYLAAAEDLAAWLPVAADDPKLLAALAAASSRFRGAVRHQVTLVEDDQVVLDGTGRESLLLPAAPVVEVAEVQLDGDVLPVDGFSWSRDGFLRRAGGCWPDRLGSVHVTYSHGYATVPEDIAEVVIDQARVLFAVKAGVQTLQVGGITTTFGVQAAAGVSAQWSTVVERYRLNAGDRP